MASGQEKLFFGVEAPFIAQSHLSRSAVEKRFVREIKFAVLHAIAHFFIPNQHVVNIIVQACGCAPSSGSEQHSYAGAF